MKKEEERGKGPRTLTAFPTRVWQRDRLIEQVLPRLTANVLASPRKFCWESSTSQPL